MFARCAHRSLLGSLIAMLILAPGLRGPSPAAAFGTADIAVSMKAAKKPIKIGQSVTHTITVTNIGPDAVTAVSFGVGVSDSYNAGPLTCPDGTSAPEGFCSLGTLLPGSSVAATFVAIACCSCCPEGIGVAVVSVNSQDADAADPVDDNNFMRVETRFRGRASA